jgi:hypothetical protein
MDAEYLVELEADRALPFEQLNCLLGIRPLDVIPETARSLWLTPQDFSG